MKERRTYPPHGSFTTRRFLFFSLFLFFALLVVSVPLVSAARARDPTLRSRLYEQFRCGNGICEVVETVTTCPEDCLNETLPFPPEPPAPVSPSKPGGFEHISSIVPADEFFDRPAVHSLESPRSSSFSLPLLVFILLVGGISLFYALRRLKQRRPVPSGSVLQSPVSSLPQSPLLIPVAGSPSILSALITHFKKKGLSANEIRARVQRLGLWEEDTIQQYLKPL